MSNEMFPIRNHATGSGVIQAITQEQQQRPVSTIIQFQNQNADFDKPRVIMHEKTDVVSQQPRGESLEYSRPQTSAQSVILRQVKGPSSVIRSSSQFTSSDPEDSSEEPSDSQRSNDH